MIRALLLSLFILAGALGLAREFADRMVPRISGCTLAVGSASGIEVGDDGLSIRVPVKLDSFGNSPRVSRKAK